MADIKKKQSSLESNASTITNGSSAVVNDATNQQTDVKGNTESNGANDAKFENISDNGSEISDEGYRSLGLIQQANNSNQSKRISLHSQTSTEDVKVEGATKNGKCRLHFLAIFNELAGRRAGLRLYMFLIAHDFILFVDSAP